MIDVEVAPNTVFIINPNMGAKRFMEVVTHEYVHILNPMPDPQAKDFESLVRKEFIGYFFGQYKGRNAASALKNAVQHNGNVLGEEVLGMDSQTAIDTLRKRTGLTLRDLKAWANSDAVLRPSEVAN